MPSTLRHPWEEVVGEEVEVKASEAKDPLIHRIIVHMKVLSLF